MSISPIIDRLIAKTRRTDLPQFKPGDTVRVHVKIKEGDKERLQAFEGLVISKGKRQSAELHRPQDELRAGCGAYLPAELEGHRQDRRAAFGTRSPRQAVLPTRTARQSRPPARSRYSYRPEAVGWERENSLVILRSTGDRRTCSCRVIGRVWRAPFRPARTVHLPGADRRGGSKSGSFASLRMTS